MMHELKTLSEFFRLINDGVMTTQVRENDRAFKYKVGDELRLREWVPGDANGRGGSYTGKWCAVFIERIISDVPGVRDGYVMIVTSVPYGSYLGDHGTLDCNAIGAESKDFKNTVDEYVKTLKLIEKFGGKSLEDDLPISCNGSWCAEQARSVLRG